jgi:hypothetical protein
LGSCTEMGSLVARTSLRPVELMARKWPVHPAVSAMSEVGGTMLVIVAAEGPSGGKTIAIDLIAIGLHCCKTIV